MGMSVRVGMRIGMAMRVRVQAMVSVCVRMAWNVHVSRVIAVSHTASHFVEVLMADVEERADDNPKAVAMQ